MVQIKGSNQILLLLPHSAVPHPHMAPQCISVLLMASNNSPLYISLIKSLQSHGRPAYPHLWIRLETLLIPKEISV